jgi:ABC-2 type transport system ATP-binding protein
VSTITTDSLVRRYGDFTAVDGVSLQVHSGESFGLLGPNGAGKSTLIKMLTTLLPPSAGTAAVAGYDIVQQSYKVRQCIGYVPQLLSADATLTGYENLVYFAKLYDIPGREIPGRVREAIAYMGLADSADLLVGKYSGGMIRRLEIAQSMLHRPSVLFLDEPTVGLDPAARRAVWGHVEGLRRDYGTTVFLTTHLMEEADNLCERVAIMHKGQVVITGTPEELKAGLGREGATLDDAFIHYTGGSLSSGGSFRDAKHARRTARRMG